MSYEKAPNSNHCIDIDECRIPRKFHKSATLLVKQLAFKKVCRIATKQRRAQTPKALSTAFASTDLLATDLSAAKRCCCAQMPLKLVAKQNRSEGSLKELNSIRPSFSLAGHIRALMYEFNFILTFNLTSIKMGLAPKNWEESTIDSSG